MKFSNLVLKDLILQKKLIYHFQKLDNKLCTCILCKIYFKDQ